MPSSYGLVLLVLVAWSFHGDQVEAKFAMCLSEDQCEGGTTTQAPNITQPNCFCPPLPLLDEAEEDPTMQSTYEPALTGPQPCGTTMNIVCTIVRCDYPPFVCGLLPGLALYDLPNPVPVYEADKPYPGGQAGDRKVAGAICDSATQQWMTTTSTTDPANYPAGKTFNDLSC